MHPITARIEAQRKKKNFSQKKLCEKIQIKETTYSSWKNRNRVPDTDTIPLIAKTLEVSLEWLITGQENLHSKSYLTSREQQLLDFYRRTSPEGQDRLSEQAEFYAQKYPVNIVNLRGTGTE